MFHDDKPYKTLFETEEYEEKERASQAQKLPEVEYKEEKEERPRKITVERRTIHKMLRDEELERELLEILVSKGLVGRDVKETKLYYFVDKHGDD